MGTYVSDQMSSDSDDGGTGPARSELPDSDDPARVLLFMRPGRDRALLAETLGERYRTETTTNLETLESEFDCCVFDTHEFGRVAGTIQSRRELSKPVFLPFVLLAAGQTDDSIPGNAWRYVDDVIRLPVRKAALNARITNLVERRRTSLRLAERERKLERTIEDLRLKEQAMDEAPIGITLAESGRDENPLVYLNDRFEELTGYGSETLGDDCRYLQGPQTDPETKATLREAIDAERPVSVDILNYRANGQKFWNGLTIAPLRDEDGRVTHYVGFQTDITDRKIRERRLEVMNRVLNHNLRNKMNLIDGHANLLRSTISDPEGLESLEVIERTTADLMGLARAVRRIDGEMSASASDATVIDLRDRLLELVNWFRDRYPDATFELDLPDEGPLRVTVVGLLSAIEEGVENAAKHNDRDHPSVEIRVTRRPQDWIDIEIADDGPGMPAHETLVLDSGETPLDHADRLGIWLMYWVVNRAGGEFSVGESDTGGTLLRFSVPTDP